MQISISPKNDNVNFEPVDVKSLAEFVDYATKYNYSTGIFKKNYRTKANFLAAESIAIDVDNENPDDNFTIDQAVEIFKDYKHIIMPSKSHRKEKEITVKPKKGRPYKTTKVADRFRIILFLEEPITSEKDFTETWTELKKFYPAADPQCKDASRFYYPSPEIYSKKTTGKKWPVTKHIESGKDDSDVSTPINTEERGQLSKATMEFLTYGVPEAKNNPKRGMRRLFKVAKDFQEQGFTIEECKKQVQGMITITGNWNDSKLTKEDIETIENGYKEPAKYEKREGAVTKKTAFKFQSISEMIEEAEDIDWLVDDLLVRGGFSIIAGPPKIGKSTLVRKLIKEVCEGGTFLGRGVEPGSVAYLTFEEQPSVLKDQFKSIGITDDHDIYIHTGDILSSNTLEDLEEAIEDLRPDLVVIDTLFDISNLDDINSYKAVYDFLRKIRNIARNTNAHILGVHHTNKLGSFMGSQAIYGAVDTMFTFVQQRERRFLFSSGKNGKHFNDQELIFDAKNQTYELGREKDKGSDKL